MVSTVEAKASWISYRSRSCSAIPLRASSRGTARAGAISRPSPPETKSTDATSASTIRARTGRCRARAQPSSASSTTAAPSLRGEELPAVIVAPGPAPKTIGSPASFSRVLSGRSDSSRTTPRCAVTRSSKKPASQAAASLRWLPSAYSSCAARVMPQVAVVSAWLSPIDSPVRGSATWGAIGARSRGRSSARAASFAWVVRAAENRSSARCRRGPTSSGVSLMLSAPPAIPASIWPRRILLLM
ncbi:hypothetical protein SDC9_147933 [bioreactor metagenome]|uniref:Uncharacterized protein n=1 Tax=bioreactor metagenome TaxID=1076179 RepID=A0A645EG80_9ZZZZ